MKAIKRNYSTAGGANMSDMQELFYGSLEEREALAKAITDKGIPTNVSDSLLTMAANVESIVGGYNNIKYSFKRLSQANQSSTNNAHSFDFTVEKGGKLKTIHECTIGYVNGQTVTKNGDTFDLNKEIDVVAGDKIVVSINYHSASIGQSYGSQGSLIILYP